LFPFIVQTMSSRLSDKVKNLGEAWLTSWKEVRLKEVELICLLSEARAESRQEIDDRWTELSCAYQECMDEITDYLSVLPRSDLYRSERERTREVCEDLYSALEKMRERVESNRGLLSHPPESVSSQALRESNVRHASVVYGRDRRERMRDWARRALEVHDQSMQLEGFVGIDKEKKDDKSPSPSAASSGRYVVLDEVEDEAVEVSSKRNRPSQKGFTSMQGQDRVGLKVPSQSPGNQIRQNQPSDMADGRYLGQEFSCHRPPAPYEYISSSVAGEQQGIGDLIGALQNMATSISRSHQSRDEDLFAGNPADYHRFMHHFDTYTVKDISDAAVKLDRLISACTGEARDSISFCTLCATADQGYVEARRILERQYGSKHAVVGTYLDKLLGGPPLKAGDTEGLRQLARDMRNCEIACHGYLQTDLDTQQTVGSIFRRLPQAMQEGFLASVSPQLETGRKSITFSQLSEYVQRKQQVSDSYLGRMLNHSRSSNVVHRSSPFKPGRVVAFAAQNHISENPRIGNESVQQSVRTAVNCVICGGRHAIQSCKAFLELSPQARWEVASGRGLCFNCLGDHFARRCNSRSRCNICKRKHHTLLHQDTRGKAAESDRLHPAGTVDGAGDCSGGDAAEHSEGSISNHGVVDKVCASSGVKGQNVTPVRLKVVPVRVWGRSPSLTIDTYAFLDEGSTTSLCTIELMKALRLQGTRMECSLTTVNGSESKIGYNVSLSVCGYTEGHEISMSNVLAIPELPGLSSNIPTMSDVAMYQHLQGVHFPELQNKRVGLLIGADVQEAHRQLQRREGKTREPVAVQTGLGWTLVGPMGGLQPSSPTGVFFIRRSSPLIHQEMETLFKGEGDQNDATLVGMSVDDELALSKMESSLVRVNGHYQVALPWRREEVKLPNNRNFAVKRLESLKKRFLKDPQLFKQYSGKVNSYIEAGHARRVPEKELLPSPRTWYIPHHATKGKFRVVFDCAASFQGMSLNSELLQGPDLTNNLVGVLLRFRSGPVAVTGDIKGMFHQVFVSPRDRDSLRFLWWPGNDMSLPPVDYQMLVHLFGSTASPSCCAFALRKAADDNRLEVSGKTLDAIRRNFYVDDYLKSFESDEQAKEQVDELRRLLDDAGFHLTKFTSNSEEVMGSISENERAQVPQAKGLGGDVENSVLGLIWNHVADEFKFHVVIKPKEATRRGILSTVSQIYDPLGFVQPFLLPIRCLMQELCGQGLEWDEPIPQQQLLKWNAWLKDLLELRKIGVGRGFLPRGFEVENTQLHCFCDASSRGYAAVAYLRFEDHHGVVRCEFVKGKSRVAPLNPTTIPRLELMAGVEGVKLVQFLRRELDLNVDQEFFWTDSTSVLHYIHNTASRFQVFVANRIAYIHSGSRLSQWRHVESKNNPADIGSRGLMPADSHKILPWLTGPGFLLKPEVEWPLKFDGVQSVLDADPELKREHKVVATTACVLSATDRILNYFSTFCKLRRAVAWWLRFKRFLRSRVESVKSGKSHNKFGLTPLSASELDTAALAIVRLVQHQEFAEELGQLSRSVCPVVEARGYGSVRKSSSLCKLSPIVVDGILRVGGRLQRSIFPFDTRHPMILPRRHFVTCLIIMFYHEREGHCGAVHTLGTCREKFWIVGGVSVVKRVLRSCFKCRVARANVVQQVMAPLPDFRVTPGKPAFTCTGVDYMGPVIVKQGRSLLKHYVCVFTCMATRAVHLELSSSLNTSSFLLALQRFVNRRGKPIKIVSDNGSNFLGGDRLLKEELKRHNAKIAQKVPEMGIEWNYNPPGASHRGGIWERIIRSVRKILVALTDERVPNVEGLATLLTEVERILNSRPLVPLSSDANDLGVLTPNVLLLGRFESSLPMDEFMKADGYRKSWRVVGWMADQFWARWMKEYLPLLQIRQKWIKPFRNISVGDIVLVKDQTLLRRSKWPKARVLEVYPGKDGVVRTALVKTEASSYKRDIRKLCLLEAADKSV